MGPKLGLSLTPSNRRLRPPVLRFISKTLLYFSFGCTCNQLPRQQGVRSKEQNDIFFALYYDWPVSWNSQTRRTCQSFTREHNCYEFSYLFPANYCHKLLTRNCLPLCTNVWAIGVDMTSTNTNKSQGSSCFGQSRDTKRYQQLRTHLLVVSQRMQHVLPKRLGNKLLSTWYPSWTRITNENYWFLREYW